MNVVLLLWRTRMRSSWRTALALVALMGLGGGVTLAVAAGARRTASANDAILRQANASDVSGSFGSQHPDEMLPLLEALPDVDGVSIQVGFIGRLERHDLRPSTLCFQGVWSDRPTADRPFVTAGRLPTGPTEILLNEGAVAATGLGQGDTATMVLARPSSIQLNAFDDLARVEVDIVGIGLLPDEVIEDELGRRPLVLLSRALTEAQLDRTVYTVAGLSLVRQDMAAVADGLSRIRSREGSSVIVIERIRANDRARVQTAVRPLVGAFAGFAALAGTTTAVVVAQALGRLVRRRPLDDRALEAVGCTRRQLVAADLACAAAVVIGGVVVALVAAASASPMFPVGPARRVGAVVRGVDLDAAALGVGAACLVVAVLTLVGLSSWRRRSRGTAVRPGPEPGLLGSSAVRSAGIRLTTGRRGIRSTVGGVAAGLAAVLATLTFTGSLDRLARDANLAGMSWNVVARENFTEIDGASVAATLQGVSDVRRLTTLAYTYGELNGTTVPGAQLSAVVGDPWPPIAEGRAPGTSREILVGSRRWKR